MISSNIIDDFVKVIDEHKEKSTRSSVCAR